MKVLKISVLLVLFCFSALPVLPGQSFLSPAPPQEKPVLIVGGLAHTATGNTIPNAVVAFENGIITHIGEADILETINQDKYSIINAAGKHIYPGFIAANNQLGLVEIEAVRATRDEAEVGSLNPSARAIIAYNTDSKVTPTIRSNGVLLNQSTPVGGSLSGRSAIVQLDAWNWEDAAVKADDGIHLNWPSLYSWRGWRSNGSISMNENYEKEKLELRKFFREAKAYHQSENQEYANLHFEAMEGLFDSTTTLYIHTDQAKSIMDAILFGKEFGLRTVIVGGTEAWLIIDFLKETGTPVLLNQTHRLPSRTHEDIDMPFKTPALLEKAGILYGIFSSGFWEVRNLPFQAGQAVSYGLEYEKALASITINVAKILGIDKQYGSLEKGKSATLFISEGDALDMSSSNLTYAFIDGRQIDLNNKQKMLYHKYKQKYDNQKNN